jgi:hypothetical protein
MKKILLVLFVLVVPRAMACSCIGNDSYCTTLSPTWYVNPVSTAMVVKLSDHYYGITVKVVQVLGGEALPNDTLTVWGDNGALCRIYLNGFSVGDTLVFGLNQCDLSGNSIWNPDYPPDLEASDDFMVSGCGVYWLNYNNGFVTGPITGPGVQALSVAEFVSTIAACAAGNAIPEADRTDPLMVRYEHGTPWLSLSGGRRTELIVRDPIGRVLISRAWDGSSLPLAGLPGGVYIAEVTIGPSRWEKRVVIP